VGMVCLASTGVFAQDKANGEKVYKAKCASCHGPNGKGETAAGKMTKARDICSDEVKKETDAAWTDIIVKGKNKMPSYDEKVTGADGHEVSKEQLEKGEHRMMDCIDCHNRPTRAFELPENAVDNRMSRELVSPQLPYIRKNAVELQKVDYPDRDTAKRKSRTALPAITGRITRTSTTPSGRWWNSPPTMLSRSPCATFSQT
jgi:cytochrome c5